MTQHTEWRNPDDGVEWGDAGSIEIQFESGEIVQADLEIDSFFTGEDEIPVPTVKGVDGKDYSLFDAVKWRHKRRSQEA